MRFSGILLIDYAALRSAESVGKIPESLIVVETVENSWNELIDYIFKWYPFYLTPTHLYHMKVFE